VCTVDVDVVVWNVELNVDAAVETPGVPKVGVVCEMPNILPKKDSIELNMLVDNISDECIFLALVESALG